TALLRASTTVGEALKKGDIVVYESTVYPGATEEDCVPILEQSSGLLPITRRRSKSTASPCRRSRHPPTPSSLRWPMTRIGHRVGRGSRACSRTAAASSWMSRACSIRLQSPRASRFGGSDRLTFVNAGAACRFAPGRLGVPALSGALAHGRALRARSAAPRPPPPPPPLSHPAPPP